LTIWWGSDQQVRRRSWVCRWIARGGATSGSFRVQHMAPGRCVRQHDVDLSAVDHDSDPVARRSIRARANATKSTPPNVPHLARTEIDRVTEDSTRNQRNAIFVIFAPDGVCEAAPLTFQSCGVRL